MSRTLSASAKAEKLRLVREQFPHLEERLDAFRENNFTNPQDVMALIRHTRFGQTIRGELSERYAGLHCDEKDRIKAASYDIVNGYDNFFETRRRNGAETAAGNVKDALAADIGKICNFSNATPYHKARQGIEGHLAGLARETDTPAKTNGKEQDNAAKTPRSPDTMRRDAMKLGTVAGTIAGVGAAAEAGRHWRERIKKPEARKKALAFAGAAVVTLGAVAASVALQRSGAGIAGLSGLLGKTGGGQMSR